jgi:hypothetical protein
MDRDTLDKQRHGSDVYGLIENVARLVWRITGLPQDDNWKSAKNIISESLFCREPGVVSTPEQYHIILEQTARSISEARNADPTTSWYLAQEQLAREFLNCSSWNPYISM